MNLRLTQREKYNIGNSAYFFMKIYTIIKQMSIQQMPMQLAPLVGRR
jgi:hypothetical protein